MKAPADLDRLLKLRLVVARLGEMDHFRWWNTRGQLGRLGAAALRRGFPRTHFFAQARSIFAVAGHRCREIFDPPQSVTLWDLPEDIEEAFEARWEFWLDNASEWLGYFESIQDPKEKDIAVMLAEHGLVTQADIASSRRLRRAPGGRAVVLPGAFAGRPEDYAMLALGFAQSEPGELAVPYMERGEA